MTIISNHSPLDPLANSHACSATGISPFLPVTTPLSAITAVTHSIIFLFRLPFFITLALSYFLIFQYLPLPVAARKIALWAMMAIPGIWWVDLQLDGVKRGTLADQPPQRFPHGGTVIAANFTSPIDAVYLAAVFDPIFTISYPGRRKVQRIGLLQAVVMALAPVSVSAPDESQLVHISDLLREYPDRPIAIFPEGSTTNGKAILPFSPSLLDTPADTPIFPVSLRYTPGDVTTPVPGRWLSFLWNLLSRPTSLVRVRIAEATTNTGTTKSSAATTSENGSSGLRNRASAMTSEEQKVLDRIAEALARLGRVKRVGLTLQDKAAFVQAINGKKA